MPILGKTTPRVMIPLRFFHMKGIFVALTSLRMNISAAITFLKADIWSYPLSTFVVKNTGHNKSK